jgi:hypothetical protein
VSHALLDALRAQGGALAENSRPTAHREPPGPPQLAARGPRAAERREDYELLLEMILEGTRLHYGPERYVTPDDPDLALLLGDQLYALGLVRLAEIGDLEAVAALADVIAGVAQAHADGSPADAEQAWETGARAIGWGSDRS